MLIAPLSTWSDTPPVIDVSVFPLSPVSALLPPHGGQVPGVRCGAEPEEEDADLEEEEDLEVGQPLADEESSFDDFDDDFDDDFEEESNDPDWDHPDEAEPGPPPPGKGPGKKK